MNPYRLYGFVRSGNIRLDSGSVHYLGLISYGWSSTAAPVYIDRPGVLAAYRIDAAIDRVNLSYGPDYRWRTLPIRCLAYQVMLVL